MQQIGALQHEGVENRDGPPERVLSGRAAVAPPQTASFCNFLYFFRYRDRYRDNRKNRQPVDNSVDNFG